jgi:hypothetical protein
VEPVERDCGYGAALDHSLPKTNAVGSLHLDWITCGKPTCRCARGILHGPYVYRRWRHRGKQRKVYVPMADLPHILAEMERQRVLVPRPSQVKRELKELNHAL